MYRKLAISCFLILAIGALAAAAPPAPPIEKTDAVPLETVEGAIVLSNKERVPGRIHLTRGKLLKVWDIRKESYRRLSLTEIKKIDVNVAKTRTENEWRFKEEGSDEKVLTGRSYARLDFEFVLTLKDGQRMACRIAEGAPIYAVPPEGERRRFLLQPYMIGDVGKAPSDLVYVKQVVLGPPEKEEEKAAPEAAAPPGPPAPETPPKDEDKPVTPPEPGARLD